MTELSNQYKENYMWLMVCDVKLDPVVNVFYCRVTHDVWDS